MTNQVATTEKPRAPNVLEQFRNQLEKQTPAFSAMLPAHVPVEKFKRVVMTAVINNSDILQCDAKSVLTACSRAAADGLLPDGREGAIVKFGGVAQWMPMTAGVLKKVRNSGELLSISAYVVYQKDKFTYRLGDDEQIEHVPFIGDEPGEAIAVYAIAKTKDGGTFREVMTKAQVEKVRAVSRSKSSGPWAQWWDEMAKKTVIRRLSKRLPMSTDKEEDVRAMLEREDEPDMQDVTASASEAPAEPRPTREEFADAAAAETAAQPKEGPSGKPGIDSRESAGADAAPAQPSESDERAADRAMAAARAGEDPQKALEGEVVDLTPIAMIEKDGKPDVAAYTAAVNAALAKITSMVELGEFDMANKPVATKAGGSIVRNYGVAVAQAKARIEGGAA